MDIAKLKIAFEALRSHLSGQQLYDDAPTAAFDREELSRLFTAYYDAEAATLRDISEAQGHATASSALDDMAQSIGYDDYGQMASGEVIIKDGKIRADLIDTNQLEGMQQVRELAYLKDAFSRDSTQIENGLVLSSFIGVRDNGKISAGISSGYVNKIEVPLIFAGADSVLTALNTASYCLTRDGVHKTRNKERTETVTISNGNIRFSTVGYGTETERLSMSPTVYTLSAGPTIFANTQLVGEPSGQATINCTSYAVTPDMPSPKSYFDLYSGALKPGDDEPPLFSGQGDMSEKFEIGSNATITITGLTFYQDADIYYHMPLPNGDPDREWPVNVQTTTCQNVLIYLQNVVTGQRSVLFNGFYRGDFFPIPTMTLSNLSRGMYKIVFDSNAYFEYTPVDTTYGLIRNGSISWSKFTVQTAWNGGVFNSKVFGNGWLYSKMKNQYCGMIGDSSNFVLEQRSGNQGFRSDNKGSQMWCNRRQEWIPVDRVLYRGYINPSGYKVKVWAYDGRATAIDSKRYGQGLFTIILPNTKLRPFTDFVVRVDAWTTVINDKRQAMVYYGENSNRFNVTLSNGDYYDGSFFFEVVDVSDMS